MISAKNGVCCFLIIKPKHINLPLVDSVAVGTKGALGLIDNVRHSFVE